MYADLATPTSGKQRQWTRTASRSTAFPSSFEVGHENHREDSCRYSGCLRGGAGQVKGQQQVCSAADFLKTPLRDGDLERPDDEAYANSYFVNANSITAPGIVDAACQQILDNSEIYSGVYGRASITFYAFNTKTSRGIACGLQNIQKIRDGEPLGGHSRAEDDFATVEDEDFLN